MLAFTPRDGRERLWLSDGAVWDGSAAIRGGVPVCWPWFGEHARGGLPAHGYVRNRPWQLVDSREETGFTELTLSPEDTRGEGFEGEAGLTLHVRVGKELVLALCTENQGKLPFVYTCALHTYFRVCDIGQTELRGLSGDYRDKALGWATGATPAPYRFHGETDRIHLEPVEEVLIDEGDIFTTIRSQGHDSLVVWNPWREKAGALGDMKAEDHLRMLCVETAITQGRSLAPGERHVLKQVIA